jgi:hypothetical protein
MNGQATRESDEEVDALRRLVDARQICFDVFPERVGFPDGARAVGYELALSGIHAASDHPPLPGCDLCREVYDDLKRIAEWILPQEHRPSVCEIDPYQPVIRASTRRRLRSEVNLSIRIHHRQHFDAPIDTCETRCLREMRERLKQIGACEGEWLPPERRLP